MAEDLPKTPIGFSKLLIRLEGEPDIAFAGANHEVRLIEHMRAKGFAAVGAENLVFGKDESARAEYVIGGTVRELECKQRPSGISCRIGVEWQVLDVALDEVVYTVTSRAAVLGVPPAEKSMIGSRLLDAALDRLLERDAFRKTLVAARPASADATFTPAMLLRCSASNKKLPEGAEDLMRATVVVKVPGGHGSGVVVSPDGYVLTAAHTVAVGTPTFLFKTGIEAPATVVRAARNADVALLRPTTPLSNQVCSKLRTDTPSLGAEVYAAGAPSSLDLAFSLTRGIVSGTPVIDGRRRIQTDAPLNPGNSGGPLADADGNVVGLVSFKLTGGKIEGLGFAVPVKEALTALALDTGDHTDEFLGKEQASPSKPKAVALHDTPDPIASLDPPSKVEAPVANRGPADPGWISALRYGGVALALIGGSVAFFSYAQYDIETTTRSDYGPLQLTNTLGWVGLGLGTTAFVLSFALHPPKPSGAATSALLIAPAAVQYEVTF